MNRTTDLALRAWIVVALLVGSGLTLLSRTFLVTSLGVVLILSGIISTIPVVVNVMADTAPA